MSLSQRADEERVALARAAEDHAKIGDPGLPGLELVGMTYTSELIRLDKIAYDRISSELAKRGQQGWCRFRSALAYSGMQIFPTYGEAGEPLHAEWMQDTRRSGRLLKADASADGVPQARLWHYSERPLSRGDALGGGERAYLRECRTVLASADLRPKKRLHYHVYWGAAPGEDPHAIGRLFDRFAGFDKETR